MWTVWTVCLTADVQVSLSCLRDGAMLVQRGEEGQVVVTAPGDDWRWVPEGMAGHCDVGADVRSHVRGPQRELRGSWAWRSRGQRSN